MVYEIRQVFHVLSFARLGRETVVLATVVILRSPVPLYAQYSGYGVNQAVGGISIKSDGLIENAGIDKLGKLGAERARLIKSAGRSQCGRPRSARSRSVDWKKPLQGL